MIGILITTSGILFLVVGLIGASIEVYAQFSFLKAAPYDGDLYNRICSGLLSLTALPSREMSV